MRERRTADRRTRPSERGIRCAGSIRRSVPHTMHRRSATAARCAAVAAIDGVRRSGVDLRNCALARRGARRRSGMRFIGTPLFEWVDSRAADYQGSRPMARAFTSGPMAQRSRPTRAIAAELQTLASKPDRLSGGDLMPPARKTARSSSRRSTTFKEPAALKRLNRSIDAAQNALGDLRAHAGRDAAEGTRNPYKGLGQFVSDARRDTGKFATALKRDFERRKRPPPARPPGGREPAGLQAARARAAPRRSAAHAPAARYPGAVALKEQTRAPASVVRRGYSERLLRRR